MPQFGTLSNPLPKKKARHRCNRHARKKLNKHHSLLTEAIVPQSVLTNLLSTHEIDDEIIVFDGGVIDNPPIKPPDGVVWRCIPICVGAHVHICDEVDPYRGLTFQHVDNVLPFIRLPRACLMTYFHKLVIIPSSKLSRHVRNLRGPHW